MNGKVGYRFHPTEEELIDYFLRRKVDGTLHSDDIRLIDIYKFEPWDLPKYAAQGSNDDEWYFFHIKEPMNRNSSRPRYNRSTKTGHWKPTGNARQVKAKRNRQKIGEKKTLVFYKYAEGTTKELRTNWVIHEYEPKAFLSHQTGLVLCKLKEKADDKAETSSCSEAEPSRRAPSDFDVLPSDLQLSESDQQLLLETLFPDDGVNFDQPNTWQSQIQIDGGISIDDLELPDDIFENGSNGLRYHFETTEPQPDPNEMEGSFFCVANQLNGENYLHALSADTFGYNPDEAASNAHTNLNHSSSALSPGGVYLEEITDMDSDNFYATSEFGDSNLNNGHTGPREYRQMQSVQSLTETLRAPRVELQTSFEGLRLPSRYEQSGDTENLERHEKINYAGKANKGSSTRVVLWGGRSNQNNKDEVKMAPGKSQNQLKLSGSSKSKVREATKDGTDQTLLGKSPKEKITLETENDHKIVPSKTILTSTSHMNKTRSSINTETSMLYQRSVPVSVYIINISIGLILFVAAIRDLLTLR